MLRFGNGKHRSFRAAWVAATVFLAVGFKHAEATVKSPPAQVVAEAPEAAAAINSVCDMILKGDFEAGQEIVYRPATADSKGIRKLRKVIDECIAIKARLKALRHRVYQTQINELEKLRQKGFSDDVSNINKVFSTVVKISEYADEEQKQALLRDPLVVRTVEKAKAKAAEFESKGKWLDAYTICYSKLTQIYKDNEVYLNHAEQLLEKADILASLQDSPCETCEERYAGIEKQMFINTVEFLDSKYVSIVDYQAMTIKAVSRCKLLAEVIHNSDIETRYKIQNRRYEGWSNALTAILDEVNESPADISKDKFTDVFEQVLVLNESPHLGIGLPPVLLIAQFAEGALSALDPYTVIYWPSQAQDFEKAVSNQFFGIGIKFSKQKGLTKVVSVLPDTPAHKSDLQAGDIIMAVDGIEMKDISSDCAVKRITGPEDTKVTLTIRPFDKDETRDITLERARIIVPSVYGWQQTETGKWLYVIDGPDKIGYVRISSFNSRTADDFKSILCQLEENGLQGLILDLRSNPGGLLNAAIEIADNFIEEGLIVRTQPRYGIATYASAHKEETHPNYPIVVLINRFTASASEIVAGVLQDPKYSRATLVGERSYGKGTVQSITSYPGGGAQLKYTAAYYYLPSGQRIENQEAVKKQSGKDWGISPNLNITLRNDKLQKLTDMQKANELQVKADPDNAFSNEKQCSDQKTIDADPQLAMGLLVLKSKMIQCGYRLTLN